MRKHVPALSKFGRLAIVAVLCFDVYGCGTRVGRDLSMAGAVQKFDQRRAGARAEIAKREAKANGEPLENRLIQNIKPLPPRRELLQVRVPKVIAVDDIADGVVAGSLAPPVVGSATPVVTGNGSAAMRALDTQMTALDKRIELTRRDRRLKQSIYDKEKLALDQSDMRQAKSRDLLLQEFKIAYEKMLQATLAQLDERYNEAAPATVLGLSDNSEFGVLAMFGRNEMARPDEYVSLDKSFFFVGNDVTTGVSLGRMDDLTSEIGTRNLSVNLAGLRLPTALRSLSRAIGLQIYLSPNVTATKERVSLEIERADALDVFDILIDNYNLALAYDRKMSVARFYTKDEFNERVSEAIATAEIHNRRARNFRRVSSVENDSAAIRQIYMAYFQHPDDAGRARALTNDAIIETEHSPIIADAIVKLKEAALENEKKLDELDMTQSAKRQEQLGLTQLARFDLDDVNQALLMLGQDKLLKQEQAVALKARIDEAMKLAEAKKAAKAETDTQVEGADETSDVLADMLATPNPVDSDESAPDAVKRFLDGPGADVLRGRVLADSNLKTSEPIYTEKFTVYNSEGANSCGGGGGGNRVSGIKDELEEYFTQLYPDDILTAEREAEQKEADEKQRQRRLAEAAARRETEAKKRAEQLGNGLGIAVATNNQGDIINDGLPGLDVAPETEQAATENAQTNPPEGAPAAPPAQNDAAEDEVIDTASESVPLGFTDSSFRRPSVTAVAETVIITGFKRDVDLAASLIESLDKADKQVLVEVFMVNVAKNWQRQLQGRLENIERTAAKTDAAISRLPIDVREDYPDLIEVRDNDLIGVRGAINFATRAQNSNYFALNNFRLGLAWTIDFMENNALGRKVSSPTILALNGCSAKIEKKETRLLYTQSTTDAVVTPGATIPGSTTSTPSERTASLALSVTPTINPLNDHVRLKIDFKDDFFVSATADSDKIESTIQTEFVAAPGDVIVLAGLYSEDNSRSREGLPGTTSLPFLTSIMGSNTESKSNSEMVIFLAPEVITPKAGEMPVNSAIYYDQQ